MFCSTLVIYLNITAKSTRASIRSVKMCFKYYLCFYPFVLCINFYHQLFIQKIQDHYEVNEIKYIYISTITV